MVCSRFKCLLLRLLLSMAPLVDSNITPAHQAIETLANGRDVKIVNKEIEVQPVAAIRRNRLKGRKMGAEDWEEKKMKGKMNTGKDVHSSSSESIDDKTKENRRNASQIETQNLVVANDELYKLMSKDYHSKGHKKPPINNHLPSGKSDDP